MTHSATDAAPLVPTIVAHRAWARAIVLFVDFFLIVMAYYFVKPASRAIFVEYLGERNLPYVWIGTALILMCFIGYYHRIVARYNRPRVIVVTCLVVGGMLVLCHYLLQLHNAAAAVGFYLFVDLFSVVLVEQFWSLANTLYRTEEAKRWYGFVGTGGLLGGVAGGALAAGLLDRQVLESEDLLLLAAMVMGMSALLTFHLERQGLFHEARAEGKGDIGWAAGVALLRNRYFQLIAATLLCAQICEPVVEYQFLGIVKAAYHNLHERTAYLSWFSSVLGGLSIAVNLIVTPIVHRLGGGIAGLLAQPVLVLLGTLGFWWQPSLGSGAALKICDRGASYSINRASKELLYIPIDPVQTYQVKAWLDMFGYRFFKIAGSVLILILTQWLPQWLPGGLPKGWEVTELSGLLLLVCGGWLAVIAVLAREYRRVLAAAGEGAP